MNWGRGYRRTFARPPPCGAARAYRRVLVGENPPPSRSDTSIMLMAVPLLPAPLLRARTSVRLAIALVILVTRTELGPFLFLSADGSAVGRLCACVKIEEMLGLGSMV